MTYPTGPAAAFDYVTFQAGNPTDPLPANDIAADYANHKTAIDAIIAFQKLGQRSDGNLQNGIVRPESLNPATLAMVGGVVFRGEWATTTVYAVNDLITHSGSTYVGLVAHTSGTFATDLAANKWMLLSVQAVLLDANQTFTGTNTFSGTTNLNGTTNLGVVNVSSAADFNAPVNIDGAFTVTATLGFSGIVTMTAKAINEAQGVNIASATTTDIGAATGNYVKVTGTTTITGLGTIQAGVKRVVEFTGALLLTQNAASLILPGGANITTAAGDCATFVSEGSGNWRCVGYQRAAAPGGTVYLGADVVLNNTSNFFSGPATPSLPPGTYLLIGKAVCTDSGSGAQFVAQIHDGSAAIDTAKNAMDSASRACTVPLNKVVTITTATTFTLQAKDLSATTGTLMRSNSDATTANLATSITWVRIG